jgi:hypothetical protein
MQVFKSMTYLTTGYLKQMIFHFLRDWCTEVWGVGLWLRESQDLCSPFWSSFRLVHVPQE